MRSISLKNLRNSHRLSSHPISRLLSTPVPLTPDELKRNEKEVERQVKFHRESAGAKIMTEGSGTGKELSLPHNLSELAALSGMPTEHASRTVVIGQKPIRSMQSGRKFNHLWEIKWKVKDKWTNPLTGWTSGADPMVSVNTKLTFDSVDDAIFFAKKQGWKYEVKKEQDDILVKFGTNTYSHNFLPPNTLIKLQTEGVNNTIFENPCYGKSHWFMPLKYHGDGEVVQFGPPQANKK